MATQSTQSHLWLCHWERLESGPGRTSESTLFWICEHPYRTIRPNGPSEDCTGCPVWEALQREQQHTRKTDARAPQVMKPPRRSSGGGFAA